MAQIDLSNTLVTKTASFPTARVPILASSDAKIERGDGPTKAATIAELPTAAEARPEWSGSPSGGPAQNSSPLAS